MVYFGSSAVVEGIDHNLRVEFVDGFELVSDIEHIIRWVPFYVKNKKADTILPAVGDIVEVDNLAVGC